MAQRERTGVVSGRVGVVGLGLIGGSFAKAMARAGHEVYAFDPDASTMGIARVETIRGELDETTIPTCELIVLACYPAACVSWLEGHAGLVSPEALVIDACGVKREVCEGCGEVAREHGLTFCGCHPMAGKQYSGFAHARADLFRGAPIVCCPDPALDDIDFLRLMDRIKRLLAPCGFATFAVATPERHDRLIAFTSQLAHVVSNAYIKSPVALDHDGFSAGSYRDLTRVAHLNPKMWAELFCENKDFLGDELSRLIEDLTAYRDALAANDEAGLERLLAEGDAIKRRDEADAR